MSKHNIPFVRIDQDKPSNVEKSVDLSRRRKVVFGIGIQPRLMLLDEDEEIQLSQHEGDVLAVLALDAKKNTFLTCGDDHTMVVWLYRGRQMACLKGHTEPLLGIWATEDNERIVSLSLDRTIRVWNIKTGCELSKIPTTINSTDNLLMANSLNNFCVMEKPNTRILSFDGTESVVLKKQIERLQEFYQLNTGKWITVSETKQRFWSSEGEILHEFSTPFSLDHGFMELSHGGLLVANKRQQLLLLDSDGHCKAMHDTNVEIDTKTRRFFADLRSVKVRKAEKPSFEEHFHHNSPLSRKYIGKDKLKKLELPEDTLKKNRFIWDFFNRPHFKSIKTAFKKEVSAARTSETLIRSMLDGNTKLLAKASSKKMWYLVLLIVSLVVSLIFAGSIPKGLGDGKLLSSFLSEISAEKLFQLWGLLASCILVIFSILKWWQQRCAVKSVIAGTMALEALFPEFNNFIEGIKKYRRRIISQIPVVKSADTYSGKAVLKAMDDVVTNKLEPIAMKECGLVKDDIIFRNQESIKLRNWAFIQTKTDAVKDKISQHNEQSFWWDGQFLFAVQFIQFIFLTSDKIDVFMTYYDFITDKIVAKEAHAFYYKDVTNISKRDVDRQATVTDGSGENFPATEIIMAVSSGQEISLTVLNDDSFPKLRKLAIDEETQSTAELINELEAKLDDIPNDNSFSDEERVEEIESLKGQIASARAHDIGDEPVQFDNKADEAIENIRNQIRIHKQNE